MKKLIIQVVLSKKIMKISSFLILLFCVNSIFAQSVNLSDVKQYKEKLTSAPLISIHGNVNSNLVYTSGADLGINNPLVWSTYGNLNFNILNQFNIPLNLNLTTAGIGYQLPQSPSRISLRPVYKWIKGYIGSNNMTMSPYTLNGHVFSGVGIEIEPPRQHLKVATMYGRLQRAVAFDKDNFNFKSATYERMGYGAKISYEREKYNIGVSFLSAKDRYASLVVKPDSLGVTPQQNFVISYALTLRPTKGIVFNGEFATSLYTSDTRTGVLVQTSTNSIKNYYFDYREATKKNNAFKIQLGYNIKKTIIGFMIERIDPGFQSFGNYFINSDLENFALNYSKIFLNNKLTISGNFGTQKDNLKNTKSANSNRFLGSLNVNYIPKENIYTSFNYSTFKTYMYVQPQFQTLSQLALAQYQNLDTLNFKQVSENIFYSLNYKLKSTESVTRSFNFNFNYQNASNLQEGSLSPISNIGTKYFNTAIAYQHALKSIGVNVNAVYNVNFTSQNGEVNTRTQGPTLATFYNIPNKKLSFGATLSYNQTKFLLTNSSVNTIISRLSSDYKIKKNSLRFDLMLQKRTGSKINSTNTMGNLSYNINF